MSDSREVANVAHVEVAKGRMLAQPRMARELKRRGNSDCVSGISFSLIRHSRRAWNMAALSQHRLLSAAKRVIISRHGNDSLTATFTRAMWRTQPQNGVNGHFF